MVICFFSLGAIEGNFMTRLKTRRQGMCDNGKACTKAPKGQCRANRLFGSESVQNYREHLERLT